MMFAWLLFQQNLAMGGGSVATPVVATAHAPLFISPRETILAISPRKTLVNIRPRQTKIDLTDWRALP